MVVDNKLDIQLTKNLKEEVDVEISLKQLIDRHSGIFLEMVNNYIPFNSPVCDKQEVIEELPYYIYEAGKKYDEGRGTKFSTFLGNETRFMCLNLFHKNKKHIKVSSEEQAKTERISCMPFDDFFSKEIINKAFHIIDKSDDSRIPKIFRMRYMKGDSNKLTPWREVSKSLGMSIQGTINLHNAMVGKIQKILEKKESQYNIVRNEVDFRFSH